MPRRGGGRKEMRTYLVLTTFGALVATDAHKALLEVGIARSTQTGVHTVGGSKYRAATDQCAYATMKQGE